MVRIALITGLMRGVRVGRLQYAAQISADSRHAAQQQGDDHQQQNRCGKAFHEKSLAYLRPHPASLIDSLIDATAEPGVGNASLRWRDD